MAGDDDRPDRGPSPAVVTLCGSMRFVERMRRLEAELTLAGHVVLAPVALPADVELDDEARAALGRAHLRKVAMADEVLVVNPDGLVGESTQREVEHARALGIAVRFLEPPDAADRD